MLLGSEIWSLKMDEINRESARTENEDGPDEESTSASSRDLLQPMSSQLEQQRDEYQDRMQRAQAELVNFKRRTADEKIETVKREKTRVFSMLLPVIDDLELAMSQEEKLAADPTWAVGIELIYRKLESLLSNEGLDTLSVSTGDAFDPMFHEGLAYQVHPQYEERQIVAVLRKGYTLDGKLLRATQVSVAHKPQPPSESNAQDEE